MLSDELFRDYHDSNKNSHNLSVINLNGFTQTKSCPRTIDCHSLNIDRKKNGASFKIWKSSKKIQIKKIN